MTKITSFDLSPIYRTSIGVDRLFDRIMSQIEQTTNVPNYPPYNIIKTGDHTFELQLAVAGFTQGEIDITVRDGVITIVGEKKVSPLPEGHEYYYQGISARKFMRTWPLGDYVEVVGAIAKDGILTVQLEQRIPDAMKPKTIEIAYQN